MAVGFKPYLSWGQNRILRPSAAAAAGWWLSGGISAANCVQAFDFVNAANKAAALIDLTGNNAPTEIGTLTWSSGLTGFSDSNYLETNVVPDIDYTIIVRISGHSGSSRGVVAACDDTSLTDARFYLFVPENSTSNMRFGYGNVNEIETVGSSAVLAMSKNGGYIDGSLFTSWSPATTYNGVNELIIGYKLSTGFYNGTILQWSLYDTPLTVDEIAAVSSAMAAL